MTRCDVAEVDEYNVLENLCIEWGKTRPSSQRKFLEGRGPLKMLKQHIFSKNIRFCLFELLNKRKIFTDRVESRY